jgi:hypothetical protein
MLTAALCDLDIDADEGAADLAEEATARLARALPKDADTEVTLSLLEDDLREGLSALADLEAHFSELISALGAPRPRPIELLESAAEQRALSQVDALADLLPHLRRRVSRLAGRLSR